MKVIEVENYEDNRSFNTRYRYDLMKTGKDAELVLAELVASGTQLTSVSAEYSTEDYGSVAPVEANSYEEFKGKSSSICWRYVTSILISGINNGEAFNGELVPLDNGGYFRYSVPKKKEMTDEPQKTPHI